MVEADGFPANGRLELLDGEIIGMSPQKRSRKARVYARNQVPAYWVINRRDRVLAIHRQPAGERYRLNETRQAGERVSPRAAPGCTVAAQDLLP